MRPSSIPLFNGSCHIKKPNLVLNGIVTVFLCSGNKICMLSTGCTPYCTVYESMDEKLIFTDEKNVNPVFAFFFLGLGLKKLSYPFPILLYL